MAVSKKKVKQEEKPQGNGVGQSVVTDRYYHEYPSWNFLNCDKIQWSLYNENVQRIFWDEILPHFVSWERQRWSDILIASKKQNHTIDVIGLNKVAIDRLSSLRIEADALISLRLTGKHRIYGYMEKSAFHILWIDLNHGDNKSCVCRSYKKNT